MGILLKSTKSFVLSCIVFVGEKKIKVVFKNSLNDYVVVVTSLGGSTSLIISAGRACDCRKLTVAVHPACSGDQDVAYAANIL